MSRRRPARFRSGGTPALPGTRRLRGQDLVWVIGILAVLLSTVSTLLVGLACGLPPAVSAGLAIATACSALERLFLRFVPSKSRG